MQPLLRDIVFLDIETAAQVPEFVMLPESLQRHWIRKAKFLDATLSPEDVWLQRAAIYAEFARVIAIGLGRLEEIHPGDWVLHLWGLSDGSEAELLRKFNHFFQTSEVWVPRLCAHNGKEFDYPFLCRRMVIQQLRIPAFLDLAGKKPWEVQHLDTLELWKFGDYKQFTSLDLLATILDVPSSKCGITGDQVSRLFHAGQIQEIVDYCLDDVRALAEVYLKFRNLHPGHLITHKIPL